MLNFVPNHKELFIATIVRWDPTNSGTEPIRNYGDIVWSVRGGHCKCKIKQ